MVRQLARLLLQFGLQVELRIEQEYIPDTNQRLSVYRRIAAARTESSLEAVLAEARDRYGPLSPSLLNLEGYARIRIAADRLRVESIEREGGMVSIKFREKANIDPSRLVNLLKRRPDLQLVPPSVLRLALVPPTVAPRLGGRPGAATRPKRLPTAMPLPGSSSSWWTARATAGSVEPGFSKQEILKELPPDPRAPGGLFERIDGLLKELRGDEA